MRIPQNSSRNPLEFLGISWKFLESLPLGIYIEKYRLLFWDYRFKFNFHRSCAPINFSPMIIKMKGTREHQPINDFLPFFIEIAQAIKMRIPRISDSKVLFFIVLKLMLFWWLTKWYSMEVPHHPLDFHYYFYIRESEFMFVLIPLHLLFSLNHRRMITKNVSEIFYATRQFNVLHERVKSLENKLNKSRETYRTTCNELREMCYLLFGWKLDKLPNGLFR